MVRYLGYDLFYIENMSLRMDFTKVFSTIKVILSGKVHRRRGKGFRWSVTGLVQLLSVLVIMGSAGAQSVDFEVNHWGYEFLDLLAGRGLVEGLNSGFEPLTRERIGELLEAAKRKLEDDPTVLSENETMLLQKLRGEILSDPGSPAAGLIDRFRERHLYSWREDDSWFAVDALFSLENNIGYADSSGDENDILRTSAGARIRGYLAGNLHFYLSFINTKEEGGDPAISNFDPSQGLPAVAYDGNLYRDDAIAYLKYRMPWFDLTVGRHRMKWASGRRGSVVLSGNNPPMNGVRLDVRYSNLAFSSFFGELDGGAGKKNIAAHRLDILLWENLRLGTGEVVVYSGRGTEFLYALPIMPFHIAEHHLGSIDNNTINFDVTYDGLHSMRFYGELFIDDYKLAKNPFKHWGNKWAITAGGLFTNPIGFSNSSLRLEYSRIEPYVYTAAPWSPGNAYKNYDRNLGHWLGPDSDELYLEYRYTPHWRASVQGAWSEARRGRLDESFNIPLPGEEDEKEFLSGTVENKQTYTIGMVLEVATEQYLSLQYQRISWSNFGRQDGINRTDDRLFIKWNLDY